MFEIELADGRAHQRHLNEGSTSSPPAPLSQGGKGRKSLEQGRTESDCPQSFGLLDATHA